jgi:hypothetical protein
MEFYHQSFFEYQLNRVGACDRVFLKGFPTPFADRIQYDPSASRLRREQKEEEDQKE